MKGAFAHAYPTVHAVCAVQLQRFKRDEAAKDAANRARNTTLRNQRVQLVSGTVMTLL